MFVFSFRSSGGNEIISNRLNAIFPSVLFQHMEKSVFKVTFCIFPLLLFISLSASISRLRPLSLCYFFIHIVTAAAACCLFFLVVYIYIIFLSNFKFASSFLICIFFVFLKVILTRETQQLDPNAVRARFFFVAWHCLLIFFCNLALHFPCYSRLHFFNGFCVTYIHNIVYSRDH